MYIETKMCCACKYFLDLNSFCKNKNCKDGFCSVCKVCRKSNYKKHREHILYQKKQYYLKNKSEKQEYNRKYYKNNKEKILESVKTYYNQNKEKKNTYSRDYHQNNKDKIRKNKREYQRKRRKDDYVYRLSSNFSCLIYQSLKSNKNGKHWEDLVGYALSDLKTHLESLFEPWMNWDNYGKYEINSPRRWNIDHIIPKSWFNYRTPEDPEFKECWKLSNLQPKEALNNIIKSNKSVG